jgi:hypothetical protein
MCQGADLRTRINPLSLENYRAKPPPHTHRPTEDPRQGVVVGNPLRSYRFDGMKPPEMSRQKFDVLRQSGHVQRQFNGLFRGMGCLISTA